MTREQLAAYNVTENLDQLMNLDPRGYGVCRILYEESRKYTGKPLTLNAAEKLIETLHRNDLVYIMTGFILPVFEQPETDGPIGAVLLARALVQTFAAKPVIVCPKEAKAAIAACAEVVGLPVYEGLEQTEQVSPLLGIIPFEKEEKQARRLAEGMTEQSRMPAFVISIEAPGANAKGEYHNATGLNVTALEAKSDILFEALQKKGIPSLAIGDLGNEIGMGTIGSHIQCCIPYAEPGGCRCECQGGILSASSADYIITATTSDWGCYGLIAALAYLRKDMDILHTGEIEKRLIETACQNGLIDMNGPGFCGIDGLDMEMHVHLVELMRTCTEYALQYEGKGENWFTGVLGQKEKSL